MCLVGWVLFSSWLSSVTVTSALKNNDRLSLFTSRMSQRRESASILTGINTDQYVVPSSMDVKLYSKPLICLLELVEVWYLENIHGQEMCPSCSSNIPASIIPGKPLEQSTQVCPTCISKRHEVLRYINGA